MLKNYIGFSCDHSASMGHIVEAARKDFNSNIESLREAAIAHSQDTIVSVIKCGFRDPFIHGSSTKNEFEYVNSNVLAIQPIRSGGYIARGNSTPLFDSVGELIESFKKVPDANDPDVSFLIMVITDGQDNSSRTWSAARLSAEISRLQATDRWTFVFRVPRGYKSDLVRMGIPSGNILEWDQTDKGVETASKVTSTSMSNFYAARSVGAKSTSTFYANVGDVDVKKVKAQLVDISSEVQIFSVLPQEDGEQIRVFCENRISGPMLKGAAFYELTKLEKKVQDYKQIMVREKSSGKIYCGSAARDLLGLPHSGDIKLAPGSFGAFDVFVQSTSVNRKVPAGSMVAYWSKVGVAFTEGPSAK